MNTRTIMALAGLVPLPVAINLAEELDEDVTPYHQKKKKTSEELDEESVRWERIAEAADAFPDRYLGVLWP